MPSEISLKDKQLDRIVGVLTQMSSILVPFEYLELLYELKTEVQNRIDSEEEDTVNEYGQ